MKVINAPEIYTVQSDEIPCFMAGGLQRCEWHSRFLTRMYSHQNSHLVIFNPKRDEFDLSDLKASIEQIEWEFKYLNEFIGKPYIFSMYFDYSESDQPICFYELGRYVALLPHDSSIIVSYHPQFRRSLDVETQVRLATNGAVIPRACSPEEHADRVQSEYSTIKSMLK